METKKEPKGNSKCEKHKTDIKKKKTLGGSTAHLRYQKRESENLKMDQQILYLKNRKKKDERKVNTASVTHDTMSTFQHKCNGVSKREEGKRNRQKKI